MTAALEGAEWSAARPDCTLLLEDPVPILQEAEWAPGPVWTGGKSRPHRDFFPDRPARSRYTDWVTRPTNKQLSDINIKSMYYKKFSNSEASAHNASTGTLIGRGWKENPHSNGVRVLFSDFGIGLHQRLLSN